MELPPAIEPPPLQTKGAKLHHRGGAQPRQGAARHQLPAQHLLEQFAAGPQSAHQEQLAAPGGHAGLGLGQQHQQGGHRHQPQHQPQRPAHLIRDHSQPPYQILHIDETHRGVATDDLHLGTASLWRQAIAAKPGLGEGGQHVRREDHVEVRPHVVPLDGPQAGHPGLEAAPLYGEAEGVPQGDAELARQHLVDGDLPLAAEPLARGDLVVGGQGRRGGEVELAVHPLPRRILTHRLTGDPGQTPAHHGVEVRGDGPGLVQVRQYAVALPVGHIDQEAVGGIRGQAGGEIIQQIDPRRPQEPEQHERQGKARQLEQAAAALAGEVADGQTQGMGPLEPTTESQQPGGQQRQQHHQQPHAPDETERQPDIGGKAPNQPEQAEQAHRYRQPGGDARLQLPAQHPQRRHLEQAQEGDEGQQQGDEEGDRQTQGEGTPGGGRQIRGQQIPQQLQRQPLHGAPRHQADQGTYQGQGGEERPHQLPEGTPRRAERLEQRHHVGLPLGEVAHRYAHGQRPQQHACQRRQAEEALGIGQGLADLGALIVRLDQLLPSRQLGLEPALITSDPLPRPLDEITPLLAAARQEGAGRLDIGAVDQRPWRHLEGAEALIRLLAQLPRHLQSGVADLQLVPECGAEQLHHPGGEPDLAGRRGALGHQLQLAIEGKIARHGAN